jgi:lysylphosphatidylglycerol synthetase-like protein (DUF2156 family)
LRRAAGAGLDGESANRAIIIPPRCASSSDTVREIEYQILQIISVLIASAVIGLLLVLLVQGKWTSMDSWFVAVLASAVMAMVIGQYVDLMRLLVLG